LDILDRLRVIFLGGKQAGVIGLLTTIASGCEIKAVVTSSDLVRQLALRLGLPVYNTVMQSEVINLLQETDLIVSVHSREIIPDGLLSIPRLGGINVHPCLSTYKGKDPIRRFLKDGCTKASVGVHKMTENVDMGESLAEIFIDIDRNNINTIGEVYNMLYPVYSLVLLDVLRRETQK
jgi:methionyl-tRNA formyltransferase